MDNFFLSLSLNFGLFYFISQLFALSTLLINLYAFQRRKKSQLLNFSTIAALCSALHFAFLGAWPGFTSKLISTLRDATAAYGASKHKTYKSLPFVFIVFYIVGGAISFESPISLLPTAAVVIYTVTIYVGNTTAIRFVALLSSALWLIYNIYVFSAIGIISELIFSAGDIISIYRYRKHQPKHPKAPSRPRRRIS